MFQKRKGLILAGGTGSRLSPITNSISKQLIPVYDKPMIYYPLSTLMLAEIRDILIITTPNHKRNFEELLGDGSHFGLNISYAEQPSPDGLAQAFLIGEKFIKGSPSALILGDNLFHGSDITNLLVNANERKSEATIFSYLVKDPERYGVVEFDSKGNAISIEEKPLRPKSNFAITGLYFYDETVIERVRLLKPSRRNELEITDLNQSYLNDGLLKVEAMGRGVAWLDTGTIDSLHDAGSYIRTLENRQGLKVGCIEEVAWKKGWITSNQLRVLSEKQSKSGYGKYLVELLEN